MLECNNLFQMISEPTRITNRQSSLLDLIITNAPGYFVATGTNSPPSNCDHYFIYGKMNISSLKPKAYDRFVWLFNSVNIDELNELNELKFSKFEWQDIFSGNNFDIIYDNWFKLFIGILAKYIPYKKVTIRPRDKQWMNSNVRSAIRKRNRLLKKFSVFKSNDFWIKDKEI